MKRKYLGILAAACSAILYGVIPVFVRIAYDCGASSSAALFYRSILSLPVLYPLFLLTRKPGQQLRLARGEGRKVLLLGFMGMTLATSLLYASYSHVPVGMATTLHFVYPILVNVACVFLFKEKLTWPKVTALGLATAGIALFMEPGGHADLPGVLLALSSGGCYAFYIVYLSASGLERQNPVKLAFYLSAICAVSSVVVGLCKGELSLLLPPRAVGILALVAVCDSVLANVLLQVGVRHAGASTAAILSTLEPITSVIVGFLVLHEQMTGRGVVGSACILVSIGVITVSEALLARRPLDAGQP